MWKSHIYVVLVCALGAWGWMTASKLPDAVRLTMDRESDFSLGRGRGILAATWQARLTELRQTVSVAASGIGEMPTADDPATAQAVVKELAGERRGEDWGLVSADGIVLARSGNAAKRGASLLSEPTIKAALDGVLESRVASFEGEWRVIVAAPVVRSGAQQEGGVFVTQRLDTRVAAALQRATGCDVVLAADGRLVTSSLPADPSDAFQILYGRKEIPELEEAHQLSLAGAPWRTISVSLGEVRGFLLRPAAVIKEGPAELLDQLGVSDGQAGGQQGSLLLLMVLLIAGAGVGITLWESAKLKRLASRISRVVLDPHRELIHPAEFSGPMATIASQVQLLLEDSQSSSGPAVSAEPPRFPEDDVDTEDAVPSPAPPEELGEVEDDGQVEAEADTEDELCFAPVDGEPEEGVEDADAEDGAEAEEGVEAEEGDESEESLGAEDDDRERSSAKRWDEPPADHRGLYEEFMAARRQCGERLEGMSYAGFVRKLERNRRTLITQLGCLDVRFRVQVRDGKATLKAIPLRT